MMALESATDPLDADLRSLSLVESPGDDEALVAAASSERPAAGKTWYARGLLPKSVKSMMSGRRSVFKHQAAEEDAARKEREEEEQALQRLTDAIAQCDKEQILDALAKTPGLLLKENEEGQVPLHLVCASTPNFKFVDLISIMAAASTTSTSTRDKRGRVPVHLLCCNTTVTPQAIAALLTADPASGEALDSEMNLPVHLVCSNSVCSVELLQALGSAATYSAVNKRGMTPLHCLISSSKINMWVYRLLLGKCPEAAKVTDESGRTPLHWLCESDSISLNAVKILLKAFDGATAVLDKNNDLPLQIACRNEGVTCEILEHLLQHNPASIEAVSHDGATPAHALCANEAVHPDLLSVLLDFDTTNSSVAAQDRFGATPLHILCMNCRLTVDRLRALLLVASEDAFALDSYGRSPLHYLCMNLAITSDMLWLFFERGHDLVRQIDQDGRAPLHYLCANTSISALVVEILFDASPSAAGVADLELKLPVQYLTDNPASTPETCALLISGPSSFRHRYDFLKAAGTCVSFLVDQELVYIQSHLAIDSRSSAKVLMRFHSSIRAVEHEREMMLHLMTVSKEAASSTGKTKNFALNIYDEFDDAKRRIIIHDTCTDPEKQTEDIAVTLNFGLVTDAPKCTLDDIDSKQQWEPEIIRTVISEIAECVVFWHCKARAVHGNITLTSIGQFEDSTLRLFNFSASQVLNGEKAFGSQAFSLLSCPPEAAKAFLDSKLFRPTFESDMWQFGCLVYRLLTGQSYLERLAPWCGSVGPREVYHLISSINDGVVAELIEDVGEDYRPLLQRTMARSPKHRWTIDRLMSTHGSSTPLFPAHESSSPSLLGKHDETSLGGDLVETVESRQAAKHAQEHLSFMKKEHANLRQQLLRSKAHARDMEQVCANMELQMEDLRRELAAAIQLKKEAQLEAQVFAHNHQSMTYQLHTTVQMLMTLTPLARKVYGTQAEEFLSGALSQATGAEASLRPFAGLPPQIQPIHRPSGPLAFVRRRLQKSGLARGCVHTWANSSPPDPDRLEMTPQAASAQSSDSLTESEEDAQFAASLGLLMDERQGIHSGGAPVA